MSMESGFVSFYEAIKADNPSAIRDEVRIAFYAGAAIALEELSDAADPVSRFKELVDEISQAVPS